MAETFLDAYLKYNEIYESPGSFWKWSAYSIISSTLGDRCNLILGDKIIYPNLYILLLAESSGHRKNAPVDMAQDLLSTHKFGKTLYGRATVPAVIDDLKHTESDEKTHKAIKVNASTFISTEFGASIVKDPDGMKVLTDIYDFKKRYQVITRTGPCFDLEKIVFSILAASNEDMLGDLFDESVIKGGFLARTLLIRTNEFRPGNDMLDIDPEERKQSIVPVVAHLSKIHRLSGTFKVEQAAKDEYKKFYHPFRADYAKLKESTGIIGRIHMHMLKLSMVLSANDLTMCILKRHMEQAIDECMSLLQNYKRFTMNHAKTEIGTVTGIILSSLLDAKDHFLTRRELIRLNWQSFDTEMMQKAIEVLKETGYINEHMFKEGPAYMLTKAFLDKLGANEPTK